MGSIERRDLMESATAQVRRKLSINGIKIKTWMFFVCQSVCLWFFVLQVGLKAVAKYQLPEWSVLTSFPVKDSFPLLCRLSKSHYMRKFLATVAKCGKLIGTLEVLPADLRTRSPNGHDIDERPDDLNLMYKAGNADSSKSDASFEFFRSQFRCFPRSCNFVWWSSWLLQDILVAGRDLEVAVTQSAYLSCWPMAICQCGNSVWHKSHSFFLIL